MSAPRYTPNRPIVIDETIDGEVVVIDLATGSYFSLLDSAARIWAVLEARPTADEVAAHLAACYDADPERCTKISTTFLAELVDAGLVVEADGPADAPIAVPAAGEPRLPLDEPQLERFDDMQDLILLDPVHDIDPEAGWPRLRTPE